MKTEIAMSYADALAKDRDQYLRERNRLASALRDVLPLAEAYLKNAPTDPDNAKLETARGEIRKLDDSLDEAKLLKLVKRR